MDGRDSPQFARLEKLPFRSGKRYRLSAWVRGENVQGGGIGLQYVEPDGRRRWATQPVSGTFDWRKISVEIGSAREPVDGGSLDILASFTAGKAWIDDVTVVETALPIKLFIDGHSVTGGVIPILEEFGRDAVEKGIIKRSIEVMRSPNTEKQAFLAGAPFDFAAICTWSQPPYDEDLPDELSRKTEWKRWFAERESPPQMVLYNWQPWGLHHWPEGFERLERDYRGIAKKAGLPIAPGTLAFTKYVRRASPEDPMIALRQLYHADFHHAGREGNYLKACCLFAAITGKSPVGLTHVFPMDQPFGWPPETLTAADAKLMQTVAWEAWREANGE